MKIEIIQTLSRYVDNVKKRLVLSFGNISNMIAPYFKSSWVSCCYIPNNVLVCANVLH